MVGIRKIAFCPHCGNQADQKLIHKQTCEWIGRSLIDDEDLELPRTYFVASCNTCNHILLYTMIGDDIADEDFINGYLEYPNLGHLSFAVPESIKKVYEEATKIKLSNPDAFAAQIRRALEAMCIDRGAKKGDLQQKLEDLVSRGELPATLAEAANLLRRTGNTGAHASDKSIKPNQVDALDNFFRAIIEYVYIAPSTLEALRDSLSR
jgi:Domain of unknown function (DUF4145)